MNPPINPVLHPHPNLPPSRGKEQQPASWPVILAAVLTLVALLATVWSYTRFAEVREQQTVLKQSFSSGGADPQSNQEQWQRYEALVPDVALWRTRFVGSLLIVIVFLVGTVGGIYFLALHNRVEWMTTDPPPNGDASS